MLNDPAKREWRFDELSETDWNVLEVEEIPSQLILGGFARWRFAVVGEFADDPLAAFESPLAQPRQVQPVGHALVKLASEKLRVTRQKSP